MNYYPDPSWIGSDGMDYRNEETPSVIEQIRELHEQHLSKCNYRAVTEQDCDVCAWSTDVMRILDSE